MTGYIPRWFTRPQTVTHPSTNPAAHGRQSNSRPVDYKSDALTTATPSHRMTVLDPQYISYLLAVGKATRYSEILFRTEKFRAELSIIKFCIRVYLFIIILLTVWFIHSIFSSRPISTILMVAFYLSNKLLHLIIISVNCIYATKFTTLRENGQSNALQSASLTCGSGTTS